MLAGLTAQPSRSRSEPSPFPRDTELPAARGGVVWIAGIAGAGRVDLPGIVRRLLEPSWTVDAVAPGELEAWLNRADETRAAIVVSARDAASEIAKARSRAEAADRPFVEVLVVSDWDALVERSESTIFEHLADFFAQLGRLPRVPAPHEGAPYTTRRRPRRAAPSEAVIRLDWHGPSQIERRVADALKRAGFGG